MTLPSYTMNLAQATKMILEELELTSADGTPTNRPLPWRASLGLNRREEDVRPVFWKNRNKSYVARTQDWDEFPNGRWGDSRSPAFGELDAYDIGLKGTNEQNIKLWGSPRTVRDVANIFLRFLEKDLQSLPWSESPITSEAEAIQPELISLNRRGLLTITSQPSVNGVKSSHPVHGWGPPGGYVYQKSYVELLISPCLIDELVGRIEQNPNMTYYAVTKSGNLQTNAPSEGPNAVTWGVFPGKEIVQPTIVETISFLAWKDEAFRLGEDWAKCHPSGSVSRELIGSIVGTWYLFNIGMLARDTTWRSSDFAKIDLVDNDFHNTDSIFRLFDGLEVPDMDKTLNLPATGLTNGHTAATNGGAHVGESLNQSIRKETEATEAQVGKGMAAPYS